MYLYKRDLGIQNLHHFQYILQINIAPLSLKNKQTVHKYGVYQQSIVRTGDGSSRLSSSAHCCSKFKLKSGICISIL